MKIPLLCISFFLMSNLSSAQTINDIFNPKVPLIFFGADYSQVQFTKADEFENKPDILRLFVDCNNLLKGQKFQEILRKSLRRKEVNMDISYVAKSNGLVDWQKVFSDNIDDTLSNEVIGIMIEKLNIDQSLYKNQLGMVFCEENCCKTNKVGKVAVVFFSINDLKPILIRHFSIKPDGFGFLFYWGYVNFKVASKISIIYKELHK